MFAIKRITGVLLSWSVVNPIAVAIAAPLATAITIPLATAIAIQSAFAQQFEPGQIIYFKYCGEKTEAKVISTDSSGVKIEARNPLTKQYDGSNIRYVLPQDIIVSNAGGGASPVGGGTGDASRTGSAGSGGMSHATNGGALPPGSEMTGATPTEVQSAYAGGGSGPMSEGEILGFLRARVGSGDPFANPQRLAILDELTEMIKLRGVNFRMDVDRSPFYQQLSKFGPPSGCVAAIQDNYMSPVKSNYYFGTWKMFQSGGTTLVQKGNTLYRRMEYFGNSGNLTINPGGTYDWNHASGRFRGKWRRATKSEMDISYKGGEGLVLLHGKAGADWIVHEEDSADGQNIRVAHLTSRGTKEVGGR